MMLITLFLILNINYFPSCANNLRPKTELSDAFTRFLHTIPTLLGYNFTKNDEKFFTVGVFLEDVHLEIDEMISKYGYPVEKYDVTCEDGYIVRLYRICGKGQPVLMMHGLMLSADDWVTAGPGRGLAYLLADEGLDVWLGNVRGTKHSLAHTSLSHHSAAFWDFSWDEIGRYDLPAMIDFVLRKTNHSQLLYVGHSQGTTAFFVMASEKPQYNDKISLMVALAPTTAVPNLKSPLLQFANYATLLHGDIFSSLLRKFGLIKLTSSSLVTEIFSSTVCANSKIARAICNNIVFTTSGINFPQMNYTTFPTIISHISSGVATKQVEHYTQTVVSQRFARFDYGEMRNEVLYGSKVPPEYNISAVTTPVAMFYSAGDWLGSDIDTLILYNKLKNVVCMYMIPDEKFTHVDFMYAKDIRELVFQPMLKQIRKSLK